MRHPGVATRRSWLFLFLLALLLSHALAIPTSAIELLVPAYGNPCCDGGRPMWPTLTETAKSSSITLHVILNPASGPGTGLIDPNYIAPSGKGPLVDLAATGANVIGYIATDYADRTLDDVRREIDRYYDSAYWRGAGVLIEGIFFDEMSNDLAKVGYYQQLRDYVRTKQEDAMIVGNPGTAFVHDTSNGQSNFTHADYLDSVDVLITFEESSRAYQATSPSQPWQNAFAKQRFGHIVHSIDGVLDLETVARRLTEQNVRMAYLTDDVMENPYDRLPSFWTASIEALIALTGDFNQDGTLDVEDIDALTGEVRRGGNAGRFDVNRDGKVDTLDRRAWIKEKKQTYFGDANLDGKFDSSDLVQVFGRGHYEQIVPDLSWADGDWNGDGLFDTADLVAAFAEGVYEQPDAPKVNAVPEPRWTPVLIASVLALATTGLGRRRSVTGVQKQVSFGGRRNGNVAP